MQPTKNTFLYKIKEGWFQFPWIRRDSVGEWYFEAVFFKWCFIWNITDSLKGTCMENHEFLRMKHWNYCNDCGKKL